MEVSGSTLVDKVFNDIFDLIQSGALPLGAEVNEVALAERFSVSRGPVREAVKRLQGLGLVTKEAYMRAKVVDLSVRDLVEIFQLRESVEAMAVRLATETMSDQELDSLLAELSDSRNGAGETRPEFDLHVRIAEGCGNSRIRRLLQEELYYLLSIYRLRSGSLPGRRKDAYSEHWQILRAMKNRDADLAESLMRSHIARATHSLLAALEAENEAASSADGARTGRRANR